MCSQVKYQKKTASSSPIPSGTLSTAGQASTLPDQLIQTRKSVQAYSPPSQLHDWHFWQDYVGRTHRSAVSNYWYMTPSLLEIMGKSIENGNLHFRIYLNVNEGLVLQTLKFLNLIKFCSYCIQWRYLIHLYCSKKKRLLFVMKI